MSMPTLLDIAKRNGSDAVVGLIDETMKAHPELSLGFARTIKGQQYKTLIRTALPTVGFRNANEGAAASKGTYENRLVQTYIFNPRWECDKAVADGSEDGAEAYIAMEAGGIMEAGMQHLASQFYYGVANDAKGFPGLIASYDSTNMVVDATGSTADTGSSVWAVKFGAQNVGWVWGEDGQLALSDLRIADLTDDDGNRFTGYVQEILSYAGLQVGNLKAVARIKKLTEDSGKGLTDDLLADMMAKFPVGIVPDAIFMSRRSRKQLQQSRTATTVTGAAAPTPTDYEGIPIMATEAIVDTEALTL